MKKIFNSDSSREFRRSLRRNLTATEAFLWNHLKQKKLSGRKFRRQHSIGPYTVDFYCPEEKLIVEVDGQNHLDNGADERDEKRTVYFNSLGLTVVRFENKDVFEQTGWVLETIADNFHTPSP